MSVLENTKQKIKMSVLQKTKQKIKDDSNFKRRPHKKMDWVGLAILVTFTAFVGLFLLQVIVGSHIQIALMNHNSEQLQENVWFKYHAIHGDSTPEKTYEEARIALLNNDLEGVLATIHPEYLEDYDDALRKAFEESRFSEIAELMTPLTKVISGDPESIELGATVVYETEPIPGNDSPNPLEGINEAVEFVRDKNGVWKITGI